MQVFKVEQHCWFQISKAFLRDEVQQMIKDDPSVGLCQWFKDFLKGKWHILLYKRRTVEANVLLGINVWL